MTPTLHDPANGLYDAACQLLEAVQLMRVAATEPGGEQVLAPVLGCLEATLNELARSQVQLRRHLIRTQRSRPEDDGQTAGAMADFAHALLAAQRCCGVARAAAAANSNHAGRP